MPIDGIVAFHTGNGGLLQVVYIKRAEGLGEGELIKFEYRMFGSSGFMYVNKNVDKSGREWKERKRFSRRKYESKRKT
jgi:hypothetical protein